MKRLWIVGVLVVCIASLSLYCIFRIDSVRDRINGDTRLILSAVEEDDAEKIQTLVGALYEYWNDEEQRLVHFVRHSQIDDISKSMTKLPALAQYRYYRDLAVELALIQWQMQHIWESEFPNVDSLL